MAAAAPLDAWALWFSLHGLSWGDLLTLFLHFGLLSLLAVGGAITAAPDMQRWLVGQQGWIGVADFTASIAIAQAAPGPNILFVALLGFYTAGLAGAATTLIGIMLPSSVLALVMGRYGRRQAQSVAMRAFTIGMTPITLGLLLATGVVLALPAGLVALGQPAQLLARAGALLLAAGTALVTLYWRVNPLWLIGIGALVGLFGWV